MIKKITQSGAINILLLPIAFLAICTLVFAIIAVSASSRATKATNSLNSAKSTAYNQGRNDQRNDDQTAEAKAAESPFRGYVAPAAMGSFEIKFPKSWSSYVMENEQSNPQVDLILNPDFIKFTSSSGSNDTHAVEVELINDTSDDVLSNYKRMKGEKFSSVTVSNIAGTLVTGQLDRNGTMGQVAIIPVRDKTITIANQDTKYQAEFDQILAQSVIVP